MTKKTGTTNEIKSLLETLKITIKEAEAAVEYLGNILETINELEIKDHRDA